MILDDLTKITELDTQNMFQMVYSWAELVEEILQYSFEVPTKAEVGRYTISYERINLISQIVICLGKFSQNNWDWVRRNSRDILQEIQITFLPNSIRLSTKGIVSTLIFPIIKDP